MMDEFRNDMRDKVKNTLTRARRNLETEYEFEEAIEDLETLEVDILTQEEGY